ncbi:MAG TPA: hypothetical protein VHS59_05915 [Bacillota bacterium]|nr:hypothetical protein [Bacillota bacterium]
MKWVKRILLILSILGVLAGTVWVLDWLGVFKVKRVLATLPVVSKFVTVEGTVYTKVNSSVYKGATKAISGLEEVLQRENDGLRAQKDRLQKQVAQLQKAEKDWTARRVALEQQIASLTASQAKQETPEEPTVTQEDKYKQLAKYYAEMKPKEAVAIMDLLSDEVVLGILTQLESDQTAKILAAMEPKRAAGLVDNLAQ